MVNKKFADFEVIEIRSFSTGPNGSTHFEIYNSSNENPKQTFIIDNDNIQNIDQAIISNFNVFDIGREFPPPGK